MYIILVAYGTQVFGTWASGEGKSSLTLTIPTIVNPHNYRPIFTQEQLASSLRATVLRGPVLRATLLLDSEQLRSDIKSAQSSPNPDSELAPARRLAAENNPKWTQDEDGLLRLNGWIYVPNSEDL
ncbi:hypothetical protein ACG7TL_001767 [Trametes sanguinea]